MSYDIYYYFPKHRYKGEHIINIYVYIYIHVCVYIHTLPNIVWLRRISYLYRSAIAFDIFVGTTRYLLENVDATHAHARRHITGWSIITLLSEFAIYIHIHMYL